MKVFLNLNDRSLLPHSKLTVIIIIVIINLMALFGTSEAAPKSTLNINNGQDVLSFAQIRENVSFQRFNVAQKSPF